MSARVIQPDRTSNASRASGSSFYLAMRILPKAQRDAMFAIYGFCRQVDDIADSPEPREGRFAELAAWRVDINALYLGRFSVRTCDLAQPVRDYGLEQADFLTVIDGMEMDVAADIRAPKWSDLDLYCDRVASAVGRLSVKIFGLEPKSGRQLAHHLGRALQLTNILRDLDEDAEAGRLYLPLEALVEAGIQSTDPSTVLASPRLERACAQVVEAARNHFDEADETMSFASRRSVRAPRIMGEVYRLKLEHMVTRGFAPPRLPVRLGRMRLLPIIMRYALI
ncbi:MAG TPA: presqualene diphosphate synthase HpnD [Xanthobacteraceae bacterium]|nr:presqualene diphosphate synthase HpnD [Xanthobacteraceae bacterium]